MNRACGSRVNLKGKMTVKSVEPNLTISVITPTQCQRSRLDPRTIAQSAQDFNPIGAMVHGSSY